MLVSDEYMVDNPTTKPTVPDSLPKYLREGVEKQDASTLRDLAAYAEAMADFREAKAKREIESQAVDEDTPEEWDEEDWKDQIDDAREDAELPEGKGTLTVKQIDGRGYYYLQWREGDDVKSQYVAPVSPSD